MIEWPYHLWCYIFKIHNNNYLKFDKKMINNIKLFKLKRQEKTKFQTAIIYGLKNTSKNVILQINA